MCSPKIACPKASQLPPSSPVGYGVLRSSRQRMRETAARTAMKAMWDTTADVLRLLAADVVFANSTSWTASVAVLAIVPVQPQDD